MRNENFDWHDVKHESMIAIIKRDFKYYFLAATVLVIAIFFIEPDDKYYMIPIRIFIISGEMYILHLLLKMLWKTRLF